MGLAVKIIYLLENPGAAKEIATAAQQKYLENFSTARMVKDTALYYKKIEQQINPG